jgi:hypothetical protein
MRLPRAEAIALVRRDGEGMWRLWSEVELVCGPFEKARGHGGVVLWRPPPWPSVSAWLRLRDEFTPPEWAPEDQPSQI